MLADILKGYLELYPQDAGRLSLLREQLSRGEELVDDANWRGHATAAAYVLSPDRRKVLLVHHKALGKWLQPGGHIEITDPNPLEAARREVTEETSVSLDRYLPAVPGDPLIPLHIETHYIPANPKKLKPEHYHHDFRYVFIAADEQLAHAEREVDEAAWFPLDDISVEHDLHVVLGRIRQMAAS